MTTTAEQPGPRSTLPSRRTTTISSVSNKMVTGSKSDASVSASSRKATAVRMITTIGQQGQGVSEASRKTTNVGMMPTVNKPDVSRHDKPADRQQVEGPNTTPGKSGSGISLLA